MRNLKTFEEFLNESVEEDLSSKGQYYWALHADLYDMLKSGGDDIDKTAKNIKTKPNSDREKALTYFIDFIKNNRIQSYDKKAIKK